MDSRKYALIGGSLMLGLGVAALVPALYQSTGTTLPPLSVETSYGMTFGLFPMNIFNKVALIVFGLAGIAASRDLSAFDSGITRTTPNGTTVVGGNGWTTPAVGDPQASSVLWSRVVAVLMGTLAVLGVIPATRTLFGVWPLFGTDALVHALFAVFGVIYGFANRRRGLAPVHHHLRDRTQPPRAA